MTIKQDLVQPVLPKYIELFQVDMTPLGGPVLFVTPNTNAGQTELSFGGQAYTPLPIQGTGWATTLNGAAPQPTINISNITKYIQSYLTQYNDLVGALVTRILTFDKYLDSGSSPDPTQVFGYTTYVIDQKVTQTLQLVQFKLTSVVDRPLFLLPKGQVLRSVFPGAGLFTKR